MKGIKFNIGDLVQHTVSKRMGVVMSSSYTIAGAYINGITVCKVVWTDTFADNLMHVEVLKKVRRYV